MNEKKNRSLIAVGIITLLVAIGGCRSTGTIPTDITDAAIESGKSTGKLEIIGSNIDSIQRRFGDELTKIAGTSDSLDATIGELIDFAGRLLAEIDRLRKQIEAVARDESDVLDNIGGTGGG